MPEGLIFKESKLRSLKNKQKNLLKIDSSSLDYFLVIHYKIMLNFVSKEMNFNQKACH